MNLEIGKKIEEVWRATGMSKVAFADKIGMNRNNVYYLFQRTNIEADQLRKIGEVLNHDFFQYYESSNRNIVEEPLVVYAKKESNKNGFTARLSLIIELDPDFDLLSSDDFKSKINDILKIVSK